MALPPRGDSAESISCDLDSVNPCPVPSVPELCFKACHNPRPGGRLSHLRPAQWWCSWGSRVANNVQKSSLPNRFNRDIVNQRNVWGILNHMVFMFLSKPASCKIVRCRDIFDVETIRENDSQSPLLLMPGHKKSYISVGLAVM